MKQNKNTYVKIFSIITTIIVLVSCISIPAFAYTDTSINSVDFTDQPITLETLQLSGYDVYGMIFGSTSNGNGSLYANFYSGNPTETYCFTYVNPNDSTKTKIAFCGLNVSAVRVYPGVMSYYGMNNRPGSFTVGNDTYLYLELECQAQGGGWGTYSLIDMPHFATLQAGLDALTDWISNPPVPADPHQLSLSVPAGNALYIDVNDVTDLSISMSMTTEVAHPYDWVTNQYYGYASSYPASFSGNPSGSVPINWHGYGQTTLFNRYKSFSWSLIPGGPTHQYFFIVNPYASMDEYDQSFNPTINVTVSGANGYKFYQMTGGISSDGTIGQQTDGTTASGTYDPSTEQWSTTNDQTGLPWSPSEGGGNLITTNSINDWLKTIATQISNFFQGAIGAITTLVNAGSDLMHSLSGLYSWLPTPVYSVLTSAIILVITIGVIKVFI